MRVLLLLTAVLFVAFAAPASAHPGECLVSAHGAEASVHLDCDNGKRACVVTMQGEVGNMYVGCGVANKAQCVAEVRHEDTKVTVCLP